MSERIHSGVLIGSPSTSGTFAVGLNLTLRGWTNWSVIQNPCPGPQNSSNAYPFTATCEAWAVLWVYIAVGYVYDQTTHTVVGNINTVGTSYGTTESVIVKDSVDCSSRGFCGYNNSSVGSPTGSVWTNRSISMVSGPVGLYLSSADQYRVVFEGSVGGYAAYLFQGSNAARTWHVDIQTELDYTGLGEGLSMNWVSLA